MSVGLHFETNVPTRSLLKLLMSIPPLDGFNWNVPYYIQLKEDDVGIWEGRYSASEMQQAVSALKHDEAGDFYCLFGGPDATAPAPGTIPEYLSSPYEAALACTDIAWIEVYCKNEGTLQAVESALAEAGICPPEKLEHIDTEAFWRREFRW